MGPLPLLDANERPPGSLLYILDVLVAPLRQRPGCNLTHARAKLRPTSNADPLIYRNLEYTLQLLSSIGA